MPRFDGKGPRGEGPMTGRGMGYCVTSPNKQITPRYLQFRNRGNGMGLGRGMGRGYGRGMGLGYRQRIRDIG